MSSTPLTHTHLTEDDARDLIAMFDRARTPEQFRHAMRIAKMRERSHKASLRSASKPRTRGLAGIFSALPKLRSL
jgi:hypothetical protein